MNLAQIVQSHALSFFHLSAPDLLLGMDSDPAKRNIFGLIAADPELRARRHSAAAVRPGDHRALGGKKIHPAWSVPGGVREPLAGAGPRSHPRPLARGARDRRSRARTASRTCSISSMKRPSPSATSPRCSWAWSSDDGTWEHYDGKHPLRRLRRRRSSPTGSIRRTTSNFIGEAVQPDSYLKSPYYKPLGYPRGHLPRRPAGPAQRLRRTWARRWPTWSSRNTATGSTARSPHRSSTTTPG